MQAQGPTRSNRRRKRARAGEETADRTPVTAIASATPRVKARGLCNHDARRLRWAWAYGLARAAKGRHSPRLATNEKAAESAPAHTIRRNTTSGAKTSTELPIVPPTSTIRAGKRRIQSPTSALAI